MTNKGTTYGDIEVYNEDQDTYYTIEVQIDYVDDGGVWRDNDGAGCPPSLDWDYKILSCTDDEGNDGCNTDWITLDMIEGDLQEILYHSLNNY
jgi:hypothetical protein